MNSKYHTTFHANFPTTMRKVHIAQVHMYIHALCKAYESSPEWSLRSFPWRWSHYILHQLHIRWALTKVHIESQCGSGEGLCADVHNGDCPAMGGRGYDICRIGDGQFEDVQCLAPQGALERRDEGRGGVCSQWQTAVLIRAKWLTVYQPWNSTRLLDTEHMYLMWAQLLFLLYW